MFGLFDKPIVGSGLDMQNTPPEKRSYIEYLGISKDPVSYEEYLLLLKKNDTNVSRAT